MAPLLHLLLLLLFALVIPSLAGKSSGVCVSPGGRFPPFSSEGKAPGLVSRGPRDLALCRVFRKNTCCDLAQTYPSLLAIRRLASAGEASQECLSLWELLECSICHPLVGVQPGPPLICESFCDGIFQACANAYFSIDAKTQVLSPCGPSDVVCGRASEWVSNGTELCHLAGFAVQPANFISQSDTVPFCYGEKSSIESVAGSWSTPRSRSLFKGGKSRVLEDFRQWLGNMATTEKVSWAIGGMVLTAGLLFVSKRKSYSRRQKQAAIFRTARKLEARINQQPARK
ncbi:Folate receptor-like protein [Dioscorea alata]|uniref:Folate receptor-like protein n=1 Tax=Dioscorea alata TaxID=55571 RepID=A0ACB7VVQ5_DIOAL|nr:Folate receptor-like protein [Dioscorea alata]